MSESSRLKAKLARLGPTRSIDRLRSGSPGAYALRAKNRLADVKTVSAAPALAKRGVTMLQAKRTIKAMVERGRAYISLLTVEDDGTLIADLAAAGIAATPVPNSAIDVRALRTRLGLTQEQFALHFGLDVAAVRNWESGRRAPDRAARSYLHVIDAAPDQVERALWAEATSGG
jgi:DNA-binding transcriptional regulator YiaG